MSGGVGVVIFSIDLEMDLEHQSGAHQRALDELQQELLGLTRQHALPATWAVADPALSAASESILAAGCGHEIAVLGEAAWLGPGCGRTRLGRELARRFDGARSAGIAVSTLALRNVEQVLDLDLLIEHGVTAIRAPAVGTLSAARRLASPPIRYGLWQPPVACRLPLPAQWWTPTDWLLRQAIRRTMRQRGLLHLEIDGGQLVAAKQSLGQVAQVMRYLARRRESGLIEVQTIQQIATRMLAERAAAPSHSILRPAA
jgi:hypothetical protein